MCQLFGVISLFGGTLVTLGRGLGFRVLEPRDLGFRVYREKCYERCLWLGLEIWDRFRVVGPGLGLVELMGVD